MEVGDGNYPIDVPGGGMSGADSTVIPTVLLSRDASGECSATLGIDTMAIGHTPAGERLRVNVCADHDMALLLKSALRILGSLVEDFPSRGGLSAIFHDGDGGRIVFLPKPRDTGGAGAKVGELGHGVPTVVMPSVVFSGGGADYAASATITAGVSTYQATRRAQGGSSVDTESYEEALMRLGVLLDGAESDFVRRVLRVLIKKRHKFTRVILDCSPTEWTDEAHAGWAFFECTEGMEALTVAARERDADRLAIIEHDVFS